MLRKSKKQLMITKSKKLLQRRSQAGKAHAVMSQKLPVEIVAASHGAASNSLEITVCIIKK